MRTLLVLSAGLLTAAASAQSPPLGQASPASARRALVPATALVTNSSDHSLSFVDTLTGLVAATIPVGANPAHLALAPRGDRAYVPCRGDDTVAVVDVATRTRIAVIPVAESPWTAAVTPDGAKLYVGCENGLVDVIDTATNTVSGQIVLGAMAPGYYVSGLAVAPDGRSLFALWGHLFVVDVATDTITSNHFVGNTPVTLALTPDGRKVVTACAFGYTTFDFYGVVSVFDTLTQTVSSVASIGYQPSRMVITADGRHAYLSCPQLFVNTGYGQGFASTPWVTRLDLTTMALTGINVGAPPRGLALSPLGDALFVTVPTQGALKRVDLATQTVGGSTATGSNSTGVVVKG